MPWSVVANSSDKPDPLAIAYTFLHAEPFTAWERVFNFLFFFFSFLILEEEAGKKHHHQVAVKETS